MPVMPLAGKRDEDVAPADRTRVRRHGAHAPLRMSGHGARDKLALERPDDPSERSGIGF